MRHYTQQNNFEDGQIEEGEELSESDQQYIKTTKAGRKDLCKICRNALAKYTCPRCSQRTCSLNCNKKHKQLNDCKGFVDPTQKVQKSKISEHTVKRDYQFVGNMISGADKVRKSLAGISSHHPELRRMFYLKKEAKSMYNIKIHQAPQMIERHRENISFYYMKTKQIYWVVELLYFQGNKKFTRHLLLPTPDSKPIQEILPTDFICNALLLKGINTMKRDEFEVYLQNRREGLGKKCIKKIYRTMSLRDGVKNREIFEFPSLMLVHKTIQAEFEQWKTVDKEEGQFSLDQ